MISSFDSQLKVYPLRRENLVCENVRMDAFDYEDGDLKFQDLVISQNLDDIDIVVHKFEGNNRSSYVFGYLSVDFSTRTTSFERLEDIGSPGIYFLNQSYYLMRQNDQISVVKKHDQKFLLKASKYSQLADVFAKVYSEVLDTDNSNSHSNDNSKSNQYSEFGTKIQKVDDQFGYLDLLPVEGVAVYNNNANQFVGINSRMILGNNAILSVQAKDNRIPVKIHFKKEKQLLAKGISDKDIISLFFSPNLVMAVHDQEYTLNLYQCKEGNPGIYNCEDKLLQNKQFKGYVFKKQFYDKRKGLFYISQKLVKMEESSDKITAVLLRFSLDKKLNTYTLDSEIEISPTGSQCDLKLFGERMYIICASDGPSGAGSPMIYFHSIEFLNSGAPKREGKDYIFKYQQSIDPRKFGAEYFKAGEISFYPGSLKKALVVDNNRDDPSLYELTLKKVAYGFQMTLYNKHSLHELMNMKTKRKLPDLEFDIQLCHTVNTLFIFSPRLNYIYGKNIDFMESSIIQVPTLDRKVTSLICSERREVFQLVATDPKTGFKYIMNYFGFDGLQSYKKIHSEIKIGNRYNNVLSTITSKHADDKLLIFIYDSSSLYYNKTFEVDFNGPTAELNFHNLLKGTYKLMATLSNSKTSKTFVSKVEVLEKHKIEVMARSNYLPTQVKKSIPLRQLVKYEEPLLYAGIHKKSGSFYSSLFTIKQRIRLEQKVELPTGFDLWNMNNLYMMYVDFNKMLINIKHMIKPLALKKIINYRKFGQNILEREIIATKEIIFILLIGHHKEFTKITILTVPSNLNNEKKPYRELTNDINNIVPFDIDKFEMSATSSSFTIALKEKNGERISIMRCSINSKEKEGKESSVSFKIVNVNWRRPGSNSLFSYPRFQINEINGRVILSSVSEGAKTIQFMHIDFKRGGTGMFISVQTAMNSIISYLKCNGSKTFINRLECIVIGQGVLIETIIIDLKLIRRYLDPEKKKFVEEIHLIHHNSIENTRRIQARRKQLENKNDSKSKEEISKIDKDQAHNIQYVFPALEKFDVRGVAIIDKFIGIVGNFGTLKIKKHFSEVSEGDRKKGNFFYNNDCYIPSDKRTAEQKKNGLCEATEESLPYEVKSLLFKKGSREVYAIPSEQSIILDSDNISNDNGKEGLSYIISQNKGYKIWSIRDYELQCKNPNQADNKAGKLTLKLMSLNTQKLKVYPSKANRRYFDANLIIGLLVPGIIFGVGYYSYILMQEQNRRRAQIKKNRLAEGDMELKANLTASEKGTESNSSQEIQERNQEENDDGESKNDSMEEEHIVKERSISTLNRNEIL